MPHVDLAAALERPAAAPRVIARLGRGREPALGLRSPLLFWLVAGPRVPIRPLPVHSDVGRDVVSAAVESAVGARTFLEHGVRERAVEMFARGHDRILQREPSGRRQRVGEKAALFAGLALGRRCLRRVRVVDAPQVREDARRGRRLRPCVLLLVPGALRRQRRHPRVELVFAQDADVGRHRLDLVRLLYTRVISHRLLFLPAFLLLGVPFCRALGVDLRRLTELSRGFWRLAPAVALPIDAFLTEADDEQRGPRSGVRPLDIALARAAELLDALDELSARVAPVVFAAAQELADARDNDLLAPQAIPGTEAAQPRPHVAALARGVEHAHEPREPQARRRQLLQRVHEREFAGLGLGVAHVDERVRLPDLVGDAHVVGARRPRAHRREEPEPDSHRLELRGLLEGRRRVELLGVGAPGERLPELLAEV
mmetsp:Transcript_7101/g.19842  ORF Transcript_7101/g.19842 Transcript_7101/m.19842 type:complete len:428 (+) Transcript_7101:1377-2660(+)